MKYVSLVSASLISACLLPACDTSDPTQAVFINQYPAVDAGVPGSVVVYRGWWSVAQLTEPVLPGGTVSDPVRVVQGSDYAYALLAIGWDPTSGTPPEKRLPVRSKRALSVGRGGTLQIVISDAAVTGNCLTGEPLSQADADFITQRIFPGEFTGQTYDAATCTLSLTGSGAGGQGEGGAAGAADASPGRAR